MNDLSANETSPEAAYAFSDLDVEPETALPAGVLDPPPPPTLDPRTLLRGLLREAQEQTSALRRARALLVASELEEYLGDLGPAAEHARDAAEIAPKLGLAAAQARRLRADDEENAQRRLEASVRLAESGPSRLHAGLVLARRLRQSGDAERASRVLDQVARAEGVGSAPDARLELERLLDRLSTGESLLGIRVTDAVASAAWSVQELVGGSQRGPLPSEADAGTTPDAPYLGLLRAAREIRAGRIAEAMDLLVAARPGQQDPLLLRAAHLASRRDGAQAAKKLLLEALRISPTKLTWRALAFVALSSGDRELLGRVLSECDPASGTFEANERLLLLALCDEMPALPADEWHSLAERYGVLAHALGPLGDIPTAAGGADDIYLRLGAALGQAELGHSGQTGREDTVRQLLGELERMGTERPLAVLLQLVSSKRSGDLRGQSEALAAIAEWEGAPVATLAALLRESVGDTDQAVAGYARSASERESGAPEGYRALAARAVDELEGGNRADQHPLLQAVDLTARLLGSSGGDRGGPAEAVSALAPVHAPGTELALALLEALRGRGAALSIPPPAADAEPDRTALDVVLATRSALRRAPLDREGTASTLGALAEHDAEDVALAVLARVFDPHLRTKKTLRQRARFLEAVDVARACLDASAADAKSELRALLEGEVTGPLRGLIHHLAEVARDHDALARDYLDLATTADDPLDRRYAYGRLAEIDDERGQPGSALLWWQTVGEQWPRDIGALVAQEEAHLRAGDANQLRSVQGRLAETLPSPEGEAYRLVLAAAALGRMDLRGAQRLLEPLLESEPPHLLALRVLEAASAEVDDDAARLKAEVALFPQLTTDLDQVACLHEAAMAAARLGRRSVAARYVEQAQELRPVDFLTELFAYHLLEDDSPVERAEALERIAQASNVTSHAASLWQTAGLTWQKAEDTARATECLQRCLELEPAGDVAFEQLRTMYKAGRALPELTRLLENRLTLELPGKKRRELELELGHLLIEQGSSAQAKTLLEGTLGRHPKDVVLLRLHAEIAGELGDHGAAEQSLASLAQSLPNGPERTAVHRALGRLYEKHFGALEKAMDAYQAALDADDSDLDLMKTVVSVYARLGLAERATQLQTELIQKAPLPDDKRREALELARLYEEVAEDPARAGATLERTRRAWPLDQGVLNATAHFYERQGDHERARALVQRTSEEARHKLSEGKLDASLLATLSAVADLSGKPQTRDAIAAARAAYLGEPGGFTAAGPRALEASLDDLLAPPVLIAPLRNLLKKTSAALDAAFPIDLAPLDAHQAIEGPIVQRLTELCRGIGQPVPDVFVSAALGSRAVPLTTRPLRLIVGSELAVLPPDTIDYLLARALKLQQLGAGALARSRQEDAWPMVVALMSIFAPNYRPQTVDQKKILQARALVEQGLARAGYDSDVPALVLETIAALRRNTEGLAEAPRLLVNRAAMLLAGGPGAALVAMSMGDKKPLPESGPSRYRWIDSHAEAKDLLLFCASDECTAALERLGGAPRGRAPPPRPNS